MILEMKNNDAKFCTYEDFLKTLDEKNNKCKIKKIVCVFINEDNNIDHCNSGTELMEAIGMMSGYAALRINEEFVYE